jgi:hypothetical protein
MSPARAYAADDLRDFFSRTTPSLQHYCLVCAATVAPMIQTCRLYCRLSRIRWRIALPAHPVRAAGSHSCMCVRVSVEGKAGMAGTWEHERASQTLHSRSVLFAACARMLLLRLLLLLLVATAIDGQCPFAVCSRPFARAGRIRLTHCGPNPTPNRRSAPQDDGRRDLPNAIATTSGLFGQQQSGATPPWLFRQQ